MTDVLSKIALSPLVNVALGVQLLDEVSHAASAAAFHVSSAAKTGMAVRIPTADRAAVKARLKDSR